MTHEIIPEASSEGIQQIIDRADPYDAIEFPAGEAIRLNRALVVTKPVSLLGNGCELTLLPCSPPDNKAFRVQPVRPTQRALGMVRPDGRGVYGSHFTGTVRASQVADPYDRNEQRCVVYTSTTLETDANGESVRITDRTFPVAGGLVTVDALGPVRDVTIEGFRFGHAPGAVPDQYISVEGAINCRISRCLGRGPMLANVLDSCNVLIQDCAFHAMPVSHHTASGRFLTAWQSDDLVVERVLVTSEAPVPAFFFESWCRAVKITGLRIEQSSIVPDRHPYALLHVAGGAGPIIVTGLSASCPQTQPYVVARVSQGGRLWVDGADLWGQPQHVTGEHYGKVWINGRSA